MHICLFYSSKIDPGLMAEPPQPTHRLKWLYLHTFIPNEARSQSEMTAIQYRISELGCQAKSRKKEIRKVFVTFLFLLNP